MVQQQLVAVYFAIGLTVGLLISFIATNFGNLQVQRLRLVPETRYIFENSSQPNVGKVLMVPLNNTYMNYTGNEPIKPIAFNDGHKHHDNVSLAEKLYKEVRVLCWIMTGPQNLKAKAQHVQATWGKRCNILLFMSSETDNDFPTVGLNVSEGRDHLTAKTMQAFKYVWDHYKDEADWFMKADDDTYVIVENLRYFLSSHKRSDPIYFGHKFKVIVHQGYFSGGGGYVMSHEALRRYALIGTHDPVHCHPDGGSEDVEMGRCMEWLNVTAGDSRDALGRSRFHCFNPDTHLEKGFPDWYYGYDAFGAKGGAENMSDYSITFHYVAPKTMYHLEWYVYHLRPYGIQNSQQDLNAKPKTST